MKHLANAAALGLLLTTFAGMASQAASTDPSGYWLNDVGSAKMEVKKCGKGICAKIVWLKDPNDSRGKPLHDARNENTSMRGRPIIGMPLFSNMVSTGPGTWVGSVYNPEEGHIYADVKITLASSRQIVLRGCKAWLLCGEKAWTKTTFVPKVEPEAPGEEQIEANAGSKDSAPKSETAEANAGSKAPAPKVETVEAPAAPAPAEIEREPAAATVPAKAVREMEANAGGEPRVTDALPKAEPVAPKEVLKPELPSTQHDAAVGYGFVTTSSTPEAAPPFSSQSVSSMFAITTPLSSGDAAAPADDRAVQAPQAAPLPAPKPKARPNIEASAAPDEPAAPAKPKPVNQTTAEADPAPASATHAKPRTVVKKERGELPWLQHP